MKILVWIAFLLVLQQYRNILAHGAAVESERATRASLSESIESIFNGSAEVSSQSPEDSGTTQQLEILELTSTSTSPSNILEEILAEALGTVISTTTLPPPPVISSASLFPPGILQEILSSTKKPEKASTSVAEATTKEPSPTIAPSPEKPKPAEVQQPAKQTVQNVQVIRVPTSNIIYGNGNPPAIGSIGGVISEALKLAQVSIAVFGSSLLDTLIGGPTYVITNTTRLVGVGK